MGFYFRLAAMKGLRKKKVRSKAVEFEGISRRRRRRRRVVVKPNLKLTGVDNIPDELLMDIFARLPTKVIGKSMCVSKLWHSVIASSQFANLFLSSSTKPMRFIMSFVGTKNQYDHVFLSSSLPFDDHNHSEWYASILDQEIKLLGMAGYVVNALRGLLCVRVGRLVRICNLTTKQFVDIPIIKSPLLADPNADILTSFEYDHVHNEYKLVNIVSTMSQEESIVRSDHQVLVLGPQASWRNTKGHTCPHRPHREGIFINGVLYYGVILDQNKCAIMSFDFTSEDFKLIELPIGFSNIPHTNCSNLINYKDKIAVFDQDARFMGLPNMRFDFWVMEDVKNMEWTKITMILPLYQMGFGNFHRVGIQGTDKCNEVLLGVTNPAAFSLPILYVLFDLEKKITKRLKISLPDGFTCEVGWKNFVWEDNIENIMYLES